MTQEQLKQKLINELRPNLAVKDIEYFLSISNSKIYQLLSINEIQHIRIDKRIIIPKEIFIDWYLDKLFLTN